MNQNPNYKNLLSISLLHDILKRRHNPLKKSANPSTQRSKTPLSPYIFTAEPLAHPNKTSARPEALRFQLFSREGGSHYAYTYAPRKKRINGVLDIPFTQASVRARAVTTREIDRTHGPSPLTCALSDAGRRWLVLLSRRPCSFLVLRALFRGLPPRIMCARGAIVR